MHKKIIIIALLIFALLGVYILYLYFGTTLTVLHDGEKRVNTEELQYIQHIPIVAIKGVGYDAGFYHGALLKQQINEVIEILDTEILHKHTIKGFSKKIYLLYKAKKLDKHIPEIYKQEMKGIAQGAGASYSDILLINTYDDLLYLSGCSSMVILQGEKSNTLIHARNLDYLIDTLADKNVIFNYIDQEFISVAFPGYAGALSATNNKGITLSSHTVIAEENQVGVPSGILYRMIIEKAATLDEVRDILKDNKRTIGNNLLVSSMAENESLVFEITSNKLTSRSSNKYSIATNHFVSNDLTASVNSKKRYDYLDDFFQNNQNIHINKIQEIFSFFDGNEDGWSSVANKGTVQSVIFLPEQNVILVARGDQAPVNQKGYERYEYEF